MERRMGRQPPSPPHAAAGHHEAPAAGQASDTMSVNGRRLVATIEVPEAVGAMDDAEYDAWLERVYAVIARRLPEGAA